MGKKHISTEIFTYVSLGFLSIITLICGIFLIYQRGIVQDKVNTSIAGILNQTSNTILERLDRTEAFARVLKVNTMLIDMLKREPDYEDAKAFDKIISNMGNSRIWREEYITIVGQEGHVFVNWENDGRSRYSKEIRQLQNRLNSDKDILDEIPFEPFVGYDNPDQFDKNKKLIGVASFIYDYTYTPNRIGIMTVSVPEETMIAVMKENRTFDKSEVYMIDKDGKILLATNSEKAGGTIDISNTDIGKKTSLSGYCRLDQNGSRMIAFYQKLNSDWTQIVMIPFNEYTKESRMMLLMFAGVAVLAIFLSLLISVVISYSISKPIKQLEQSIDQINKGNLKDRVYVVRKDDIGKLGEHFNDMADNLEHLIEEKIENQKRTSELVIANKTAELKMLHAQINPHFLFNTLNSIRCLAIINKAEYIAHMLESLGALLENSIMKGQENTSVESEVSLLRKYIELQQMRYGKRLKAEFLVDEELYGIEIPRFMLQPLVENAITHGIALKVEGGTIKISGERQQEMVRLTVEDDGVGLDEDKVRMAEERERSGKENSNHGIALSNIRSRLKLIYGERCGLEIKTGHEGKGTIAVLWFPAKKYGEDGHA